MSLITAALVKELREKTGAGMMDCKNALVETNGNIEEAIDWLRKKGISGAEKKSARVAADGVVTVSMSDNSAALVEINSETDFVSRNPDFQNFAKNVSNIALNSGSSLEELQNAKYLVMVGVCTHLGCVPLGQQGEYGGWFCPCHGSHYDTSGRIRKGPAPTNLEVPPYVYLDESTIKIG